MNLLAIGNSFSDDALAYAKEIAASIGEELNWCNLYYGGCSIEKHLNFYKDNSEEYEFRDYTGKEIIDSLHVKTVDGLKAHKWDVITLQQASHESGQSITYRFLKEYMDIVKSIVGPNVKYYWHMTWAYQQDSTHPCFPNYHNSQKEMYECILDAVNQNIKTNKDFSGIIPNGVVIQNVRKIIGDKATRDGFHMSIPFGRYITGLTYVAVLFPNADISKVSYKPQGLSDEELQIAKDCVIKTIKEYK